VKKFTRASPANEKAAEMVGTNYHYVSDAKKVKEAKARQGSRTDIVPKIAQCNKGKSREKAAEMVGTNHTYVSDAKKIKEAKARQGSRTDIPPKMAECNKGKAATKTSGFC
jgi:hypothetical protein